jgi:hypothetical protein
MVELRLFSNPHFFRVSTSLSVGHLDGTNDDPEGVGYAEANWARM